MKVGYLKWLITPHFQMERKTRSKELFSYQEPEPIVVGQSRWTIQKGHLSYLSSVENVSSHAA